MSRLVPMQQLLKAEIMRRLHNEILMKRVALPVLSLFLTLGAVELVLRWTHLATDLPWTEGHPLLGFRYVPNQTGMFVVGKFGDYKTQYRINSDGWNSSRNYAEKRDLAIMRIAIIGDSYVEALNVSQEAALAAVLEKHLARIGKVEVYAFGVSGASLAHYLAIMRYVRLQFSPDLYIINIVHNDFDESLSRKDRVFFHAVRPVGDSYEEVTPQKYRPTLLRRMTQHFAIARYLRVNLKIKNISQKLRQKSQNQPFEANIDISNINVGKTKDLVRYLFEKYLREVSDNRKRLVFVIDAPRQLIYNGILPQKSSAFQYNKLTIEVCRELSLYCLDLTDPFWREFQQNKRRFNSVIDGHWDRHGHEIAARAIGDFLLENVIQSTAKVVTNSH